MTPLYLLRCYAHEPARRFGPTDRGGPVRSDRCRRDADVQVRL